MKLIVAAFGLSVLALGACATESVEEAPIDTEETFVAMRSSIGGWEYGSFTDLETGERAGGFAAIKRGEDEVQVKIYGRGTPGATVSLWVGGANDTSNCYDGPDACDLPDLMENPDTEAFVGWGGAGTMINDQGRFSAYARVPVGDWSGEVLFGDPLASSDDSAIVFFLHEHGDAVPGATASQLTTFTGGCPPNECITTQAVVFQAN